MNNTIPSYIATFNIKILAFFHSQQSPAPFQGALSVALTRDFKILIRKLKY